MSRPPSPLVLLHLPAVAGRDALRAGLMAMQCVPENLPLDQPVRHARLQKISPPERVFCVIDISSSTGAGSDHFGALLKSLPHELRARTLVTRLEAGHVSAAERAWVKTLGFADLLPKLDARDPKAACALRLT